MGESKDGGRGAVTCLQVAWPSRGREHFGFYERSDIKNLVIRDRFSLAPPLYFTGTVTGVTAGEAGTGLNTSFLLSVTTSVSQLTPALCMCHLSTT